MEARNSATVLTILALAIFIGTMGFTPFVCLRATSEEGLVAYFSFNGNAIDVSGNGNDGVVYGATYASGVSGSALRFDGEDDYVKIPSVMSFNEITFSAWIKIDDLSVSNPINNRRLFTVDDGGDPNYYYFDIEGSTRETIGVTADGWGVGETDPINTTWTHIAVTYNCTEVSYSTNIVRIYKDGVLNSVNTLEASPRTGIPYIGGVENPNYLAQAWDGRIDEVAIYDRILSAEEIKELYDEHAEQVVFRGINISHLESRWEGVDIKSELSRIRSHCFNGVRLHLYWEDLTPDSFDMIDAGAFTSPNGRAASIDDFVNWCEDVGLYIMLTIRIDSHHPPPAWAFPDIPHTPIPVPGFDRAAYWDKMMNGDAPDELESIINIWDYIADRYKDRPHVLFDVFNEPRAGDVPHSTIAINYRTFAEDVIQTIREREGIKHKIVVEEYEFLSIPDNIQGDSSVLRDIHFYTPWQTPYSHEDLPVVRADLQERVGRLRTTGLEVECGEFGRRVYPTVDPGSEEWFNDVYTLFEENNIENWWVFNWAPHEDESYSIVKPDGSPVEPFFSLVESHIPRHDVAAIYQKVLSSEVYPGELIDIEVHVENLGCVTESFDVTCYHDDYEIGTRRVENLGSGSFKTLTFTWDTGGFPANEYLINAWADSGNEIEEIDEENNWCHSRTPVFIIPELPSGTVMALISTLSALTLFLSRRKIK